MIADITRGGNKRILQDPQQLLKKILVSLRGAVFILDAPTVEILDCNPAASEMFGYSRDEMLGQTTTFLHVDESSLEEFRTQLYTAVKVEGFLNLPEFRMKRKNGEIFFTDHTVMPLKDDHGILIGWVSVVRDITKHKQMMEALRQSDQRFRQLAENIEVVFWMESPDGAQIHYVSPAFEKIWGISIEDLMRDRNIWVRAIHPDDSPRILRWLKEHHTGRAFDVQEFRIIRPDGEIRWVSDSAFPVRNEKGEIYRVAGFAEDITERKRAEEALRQQAQLLRLSYDAIIVWQKDGGIEHWNRGAEQLYGFTESEVLGRITHELLKTIPPAPWPEVEATMRKHGQWEGEVRHCAKDGREVTVLARHQLVLGTDGIERILETNRDITDRKEMEEELRRSRDDLEMRVQERTEELQAINEELRTENEERLRVEIELRESENRLRELSTALLNAQESERKLIAQEIHDSMGASLTATKIKVESAISGMGEGNPQTKVALESVISIIQGTIDEARRIQMSLRPSVLDDLGILAAVNWFCRQFEETYSKIRIRKEIDIQEHEVPESLKIVIYRVLQEALNNIAKHSKALTALISLQKVQQAIQLVVRDSGQGFDLEEVYSRRGTTKGLGLSSMRERIELSGGFFSIESRKGTGTVIQATWPSNNEYFLWEGENEDV